MSFASDARTILHLLAHPIRGESHAERLENFYHGQAAGYDSFRERLLQGRRELIDALPLDPGMNWVDVGAGTGGNLEFAASKVPALKSVTLVDLAPSLLEVARQRVRHHGWKNVHIREADATSFSLPEPADVVTFSYSLTMIPDWIIALEHALALLKPGGILGVVDFYVSRKYAGDGEIRHGWWTRTFWPTWFAFDNVWLNRDLLPLLRARSTELASRNRELAFRICPSARSPGSSTSAANTERADARHRPPPRWKKGDVPQKKTALFQGRSAIAIQGGPAENPPIPYSTLRIRERNSAFVGNLASVRIN